MFAFVYGTKQALKHTHTHNQMPAEDLWYSVALLAL